MRESLRQAVEHGVLVAEQATGSFRFRHALLAEVVYATLLPGEREELHARLAEGAGTRRPRRRRSSRPTGSLQVARRRRSSASVEAARQAEAAGGGPRAPGALGLARDAAPDAPSRDNRPRRACSWAAELASQTGVAPRAVQLAQQAIELVEERDPFRAACLYDHLGRYLHESGRTDAALSAFEHVVDPCRRSHPPRERAHALAALGQIDAGLAFR